MTASEGQVSDVAPAGPRRQQRGIRLPQLLLSLLVVAVFALLAVWWQANTTSRDPVLALANDVELGVPIGRSDLTEIYISTDVPAGVTPARFVDVFVGAVPRTDLPAGTLINDRMFRATTPLAPGQAFVGLELDATRGPSGLDAGDRVQIIVEEDDGEFVVLSADARVEVAERTDTKTVLRLRLDVDAAQAVQVRADDVVVIEVDSSGPADWEVDAPS